MNSFGYESLNEVFFDVFEIKGKNLEFIKEKKGDLNGDPIIELDLCIENQKYKNVRFVLKKNGTVNINPKLLDHLSATIFEQSNSEDIQSTKKFSKKIILEKNTNPASRPASRPASQSNKTAEKSKIVTEKNVIDTVKEDFFNSIKGDLITSLKEEIKAGIIADMLKENLQDNFDNFINQDDKSNKLYKLFEQTNNSFRKELMELIEKVSKREALRYAESGGGTNATQYANGGVMDGNLKVTGSFESNKITTNSISANSLSSNNQFITNNLTVGNNISAKNLLIYDTISAGNNIYSNYAKFYDLTVNHNLSVNNNLITNYETVTNDLSVLGNLHTNGSVNFKNGSSILGDVVITGNLTVSQEIFGDLVSGNTIVNSSGDTLLAKAVKNISGSNFVDGNYTVRHNLSSYDLLMSLYYINPNGTREIVHASMINDTLSTTQISFASQPEATDNFKLIIMS